MSDAKIMQLLASRSSRVGDAGDRVYVREDMVKHSDLIIELCDSALLVVREEREDYSFTSFAVMQLDAGPSTRDGVECDPAEYSHLFSGEGPASNLRELRHTYWGDEGYLFDPPATVIADAFKHLKRWFD